MYSKLIKAKQLILALVLAGFSTTSSALDNRAGEIQLDEISIYPHIRVSARHDDNLLRSESNKTSSLIGIVTPAVKFVLQDNIKKFTLDYGIEAAYHENSSTDDYTDQKLLGGFTYHPSDRIKTQLRVEFLDEHDPRGTSRTEGTISSLEPDKWHSYGIGAMASYGSPNATGRIELETSYVAKEYDNNQQFTFVRDRNDLDLRGTFYYKIRPKTQLLFEVRQKDFKYDRNATGVPTLDSTNRDYLLGISWDATYKTTGVAKFGITEKDFDSDFRRDAELFKWEMGLQWKPKSYSVFDIRTERRQDETNGIGDSIDVGEFMVSWNHTWRDRISSTVEFFYAEDDYAPSLREDDRFKTGARINYDWRRWARVSVGYRYEERDSNIGIFDYQRNLFDLTVNFTL